MTLTHDATEYTHVIQLSLAVAQPIVEGSPQFRDLQEDLQYILPRLLNMKQTGDGELRVLIKNGRVKKTTQLLDDIERSAP